MSHIALNSVRRALGAEDCHLKPLSRLVLMILAEHAGKDGTCWPSRKTLSRLAGTSEASIKRALAELVRGGYIARRARHGETGAQSANLVEIVTGVAHRRAGGGSPVNPGGLTHEPGGGSNAASPYKEEPPLEPSTEPSVVETADARPPKFDSRELYRKLVAAANSALCPMAKGMGLVSVAEPIGWIQSGADLELDILPALEEVSHRTRPGSVRAWSYFRGAVSDHKHRRERGLPPPTVSIANGNAGAPAHMRRYA